MTEKEMLEEANDWLTHIKFLAIEKADDPLYQRRLKTFEWLLEQTERVQDLKIMLKVLGEQNNRYKQALEFYADEEHYKDKQISKALCDADGVYISNDEYLPSIIYLDKGETARKALEGKE